MLSSPVLLGSAPAGYQLQRSLRFRASASAFLNRTFTTATNRRRSTLSLWVKRGALGRQTFFSPYLSGSDRAFLEFDASDRLNIDDFFGGAASTLKTTTAVYRDPSAHYHVVLVYDTPNTTAEDRTILYVNNVRVTSWANNTICGQNIDPSINGPRAHFIGQLGSGTQFFDGLVSDVHFIDGQALTPTSFGQFDSNGMWQPRAYTGTYGTNGFRLDFSDPTSTTTLVADRSGNGNNWTANNISLTAGVTYDSMIDVPLGGGGGERGNYATLNPLHTGRSTLTNGNLTASGATDLPTIVPESGTWYFERGGSVQTWTPPAAFPAGSGDYNFGQRPWQATGPTGGQKALHTGNLPAAPIPNPKLHFDVVTHLGSGVARSVTGAQFRPDFVWVKNRNSTQWHGLYNSISGVGKYLVSNSTNAEATFADTLTSFDSAGFSTGNDVSGSGINTSANTYVDWLWRAGGAAVTNTAGSISAQVSANPVAGFSIVTWTGNTTSGATVGHGLGVAPAMIIFKNRSGATDWHTYHKNIATPATNLLYLNTTAAPGSSVAFLNSVAPSSSVITLGNSAGTNGGNMVAYCFSEIPGYSRISSYTGNGSTDGPFVYCGFRPRWIMMKSSNDTFNWMIFDTARGTVNVANNAMLANDSAVEQVNALWNFDILSNGFKPRGTNGNINGNGTNYIFYAIAEAPFQSALAR